jgi:hypothetical protein
MNGEAPVNPAIQEIVTLTAAARDDAAKIEQLLAIVADSARESVVRQAAFRGLQQLSFSSVLFRHMNAQFIATLRTLMDDPDPVLRELAIERLAQDKDALVQQRLLDGLERREEPLVDDVEAIQLLGYDIHGAFFPVMRKLAKESPDPAVRTEAVNVLAADTASADLLLEIFDDKSENDDVRRASASALMLVARDRFEPRAKEAVLDDADTEAVRASSLTALTHSPNREEVAHDSEFVARLSNVAPSAPTFEESVTREAPGMEPAEGDFAKAIRIFKERRGLS